MMVKNIEISTTNREQFKAWFYQCFYAPGDSFGKALIVGWPSTAPSLVVGTSKCHAQASVTPRIPQNINFISYIIKIIYKVKIV